MENLKMKKIIFAALMLIPMFAYAGTWFLISSDYQNGTGFICTYQLQGTSYTMTIISPVYACQSAIYQ
jgi:hypothetical protein